MCNPRAVGISHR